MGLFDGIILDIKDNFLDVTMSEILFDLNFLIKDAQGLDSISKRRKIHN